METVFEHNPTKEELNYLFDDFNITREEYLSYGDTQAQAYVFIYYLYRKRKDKENMKKYMDKIPNTFRKWNTICYHDVPSTL